MSKQSSAPRADFSTQLSEPGLGKWAGIVFAGFSLFWVIVLVSHQSLFLAQQQRFQAVAPDAGATQGGMVDGWDSQRAARGDRSLKPQWK